MSILRYRMLDLMPIAREHVFTSMPDGLVVLDNKMRIIDANPGSMKIFSWEEIPFGALVENIWKPYPMLIDMLREPKSESIVMEVNKQKELFFIIKFPLQQFVITKRRRWVIWSLFMI